MRVIFAAAKEDTGRAGSLKGGLRRPSLGIMNFWFVAGTERVEETAAERSVIVAERGRVRVWGVLWWERVMVWVSSSASGDRGASSAAAIVLYVRMCCIDRILRKHESLEVDVIVSLYEVVVVVVGNIIK